MLFSKYIMGPHIGEYIGISSAMLACPLAIEVPMLFGKYQLGIFLGISSAMVACPLAIEVPILFSKYYF
jgi:hypothetical protein